MKIKSVLVLFILSLTFSSCSRNEPFVAPVIPPPPTQLGAVVMNELYAMGVAGAPDWVELYNPNTTAVDISGYKIYDSGGQGGTKEKKAIPAGTSIPAKGFFVIVTDDGTASGFGLSSGGEDVWLENASGAIIDNTKFLVHTALQSCSRIPDGSGAWQVSNTITRGASNKQ